MKRQLVAGFTVIALLRPLTSTPARFSDPESPADAGGSIPRPPRP